MRCVSHHSLSLAAPLPQGSIPRQAGQFRGIAEADETYFLESFKGSHSLPRPPGIVASETPGSPSYWIFPVKSIGDMTTEEIVRTLVETEKVFAFGPRSFGRRRLRSGDWMCFYASRKGVIAHAQVASEPIQNPLSKVLDPLSYPWTFSVKKVVLYPEKPVPLNPDTRSRLDAFKNRNPDTAKWWNWFVKTPHKISEHDFKVLTRS